MEYWYYIIARSVKKYLVRVHDCCFFGENAHYLLLTSSGTILIRVRGMFCRIVNHFSVIIFRRLVVDEVSKPKQACATFLRRKIFPDLFANIARGIKKVRSILSV
jgi:hypothetical protein